MKHARRAGRGDDRPPRAVDASRRDARKPRGCQRTGMGPDARIAPMVGAVMSSDRVAGSPSGGPTGQE